MFAASKTKQISSAANFVEDVFSTYLYTGNGSTQTITNGIDLSTKGGLVWIKDRNSGAKGHALFDTARGVNLKLQTQSTNGQFSGANQLTAFNATGFDLGSAGDPNGSGTTYASWTFRKQPKFFDVVTWTGNGAATQTISHNLGSVPGCIIAKLTSSTDNWYVYHRATSGTPLQDYTRLNLTNATNASGSNLWGATSTTITVDSGLNLTTNGATYVAYIFAHNAGGFGLTGTDNVISCGSFTTDGSGNATVNLGYEPQFLITKQSSGTGYWRTVDTMRGWSVATGGGSDAELYPNASAAENFGGANTNGGYPTATGFVANGGVYNASSTYIYIAIRRGPMKVPTDGTKVFAPVIATGSNPQTVTTNFPVDLILNRQQSNASQNYDVDRLRGGDVALFTNTTGAEQNIGGLVKFDLQNSVQTSISSQQNIDWAFRRAPSFFDEVCYTGTGSATTVTHNLGVAPTFWIVKKRSASESWVVGYASGGANAYLTLQTTDATASDGGVLWNNALPTSTVLNLGSSTPVNGSGSTYVAYLFATCTGVSKVGSYTGNGSSQTINCGFTGGARFVLIKRTDSTGDWYVYDTARGMTTLVDPYLLLNSTAAESATLGSVTTVTTGFAVNASILAAINTNGASYIFLAIA